MSYYVWRTNTVLSENPHLNLGGEFARSARWPMMISQIETPRTMHVKPKTPIRADPSEKNCSSHGRLCRCVLAKKLFSKI